MNGEQNPAKREELFQQMKTLNKRGKTVETNTLDSSSGPFKSMGWRWKPDKIEPVLEEMIESELAGDSESAPIVMSEA